MLYAADAGSSTHQSPQRTRRYGKLTPGFGSLPYMIGWIRNVPIGVVPSPSRRFARSPFRPTRAGYAALAGIQHGPERRHVLNVACVVRGVAAATVISCVVPEGGRGTSSFATFDGHGAASAAVASREASSTRSEYGESMRVAAIAAAAVLVAGLPAAASAPPSFGAKVSPVTWADIRFSYRAGCPVPPAQLRTVRLSYWGFDGRRHEGALVVNKRVAQAVVGVFARLYDARFPIRRMVPVSAYRGSDDASMAADNTSAFNCRRVEGSTSWSMHAYGEAIDLNPIENPYVLGRRVLPRAGRRYLDRARVRAGMVVDGGVVVRAFESVGWKWGGRWTSLRDYQHFSTTGR